MKPVRRPLLFASIAALLASVGIARPAPASSEPQAGSDIRARITRLRHRAADVVETAAERGGLGKDEAERLGFWPNWCNGWSNWNNWNNWRNWTNWTNWPNWCNYF